jgi:hypothetical protein
MILLTKNLDIESSSPSWSVLNDGCPMGRASLTRRRLLFYHPVTALASMFTQVICNTNFETADSDIALMEIVIGHLGRLHYITSGQAAFNEVRELVRLAQAIVQKKKEQTVTVNNASIGEFSF